MKNKNLFAFLMLTNLTAAIIEARHYENTYYENAYDDYGDSYGDSYNEDDCYEVLREEYITYRGDRGERVAQGAFSGAASGALIGGLAGGGRGAGIGAGVGAGLGIIGGASSGRGRTRVLRQTCRSRDGRVFVREMPAN